MDYGFMKGEGLSRVVGGSGNEMHFVKVSKRYFRTFTLSTGCTR